MPNLPITTICGKSNGGILNTIGWRESGCFKINTLYDELKISNEKTTTPITEPRPQAFPTILELAQLSQHVYTISEFRDDKEVPFVIEHMTDWTCIGTGRYSDGYCGAAYVNYKHSHVVIAHGGTEFIITKPIELYRDFIITDVGGVGLNQDVSQISSAYIFTKIIVNLCSDTQFSISVTGHSLGGWLAQISAFYIEHTNYLFRNEKAKKIVQDKQNNLDIQDYVEINKPIHLHTVSFDSPGCRQALKKVVGYYGSKAIEWRENVDTLDFTVIIAPSNSVNTCGEHVGHVLELDMISVTPVSWITESHGIQNFVDHLSVPVPKLREVHNVHWWKPVQSEDTNIILDQWYIGRKYECQLNTFSPKELEILTRTQIIFQWRNNQSLKSSWSQKFGEEKHKRACEILEAIEEESLTDFIQNFNATRNVIEFPKKSFDENQLDMSKLIWKLIRWFRFNRVWLHGGVFQNVIGDLPGCRDMICESEGSLYLNKFPKLHGRKCTTKKLCDKVRAFLGNGIDKVLHIHAGSDGRQSRLYVVHLYNCFGSNYGNNFGEHVLFINISNVQRLHREIEMANIFSQTKFRLIVVECDSKIEEMNDVITGMIANVESGKKKLIIVTIGDNSPLVNDYPPLECDVDLTLQLENLDDQSKQVISQCHIVMHGDRFMLGKSDPPRGHYLLENLGGFFNSEPLVISSKIICDIFDGRIIELSGGSLPIMAQHYIDRTLFQITLNSKKLRFNAEQLEINFSDILVVSNCDGKIKKLIPQTLFVKELIHEVDCEYTKECFMEDCKSKFMSRNVHWFKKEGSMLVWQMSIGQPCCDYLSNDKGEIPDSDLHGLINNFIILADEPGMGKSAAITKLFLEYNNVQFNSTSNFHLNWPVYINLNTHQAELRETTYSSDAAIRFLTKASNLLSDFEKLLFKFCLEKLGNVTLFIDSFDEISEKGQDFVVRILEHLKGKKHSRIRVWIATRNYAKYELEKRLETKSYRFHRVGEEAQIKFLVNNWTHNVPFEQSCNQTRVKTFAKMFGERALTEVRKVLGKDGTFIGIPLQLVLLAAIYNDKFLQLLENKVKYRAERIPLILSDGDWDNSSTKFSSTLELYNLFVDKKMNIWLEDKFKLETRTEWMEKILRAEMIKIHSQAAFLYVSSSILTNSNITTESLSSLDSYEVNRVGLCERIIGRGHESVEIEISESNFRFHHQTIAEYFTAKYLVNLIRKNDVYNNNVVSFLKTHYHQPYFKKIRYFLDSLLCTDIPGLKNLELLNTKILDGRTVESLQKYFKDSDWERVDALGRNLLHYGMAYGDHESGILWMIAKDLSLFHTKDHLGETCLTYICLSESLPQCHCPNIKPNTYYKGEQVQLIYTIFCGLNMYDWCIKYPSSSLDLESTLRSLKIRQGFTGINHNLCPTFIKTTNPHLLIKHLEINMAWLSHCTVRGKNGISKFLSRVCIHNTLDNKSGMLFLNDWLEKCLSEDGDGSYELGAELISVCRYIEKWDKYVFTILRNNLATYYHNVIPYLCPNDENYLWQSCLNIEDKRKMLFVMKNHNFYSLFRAMQWWAMNPLIDEVIGFIYRESDGSEFRDALNKGLANAFYVFIYSNKRNLAFYMYEKSDYQTRKQMITNNFVLRKNAPLNEHELNIEKLAQFMNIMRGKHTVWDFRHEAKFNEDNFQSKFFTLPVLVDYSDDQDPMDQRLEISSPNCYIL